MHKYSPFACFTPMLFPLENPRFSVFEIKITSGKNVLTTYSFHLQIYYRQQ